MPGGTGIIIGAGAELIAVSTIGNIPKIAGLTPPTLNDSVLSQRVDGAVNYITVAGSYITALGYTETVRTKGGIISEGLGTGGVRIGQGADLGAVGKVDAIAIGRAASATNDRSIAIGVSANTSGQSEVIVIGSNAALLNVLGLVMGTGAYGQGNAGGSYIMSIGVNANVLCNSGGNSTAVGNFAVARQEDTVIGHTASSNVSTAFSNSAVVIGFAAHANKAQSINVVIGASAFSDKAHCTVVGGGAQTLSDDSIMLGYGTVGNAASTKSIVVGNSAVSNHASCIILGHSAISLVPNLMVIGGVNSAINVVLIGSGNTQVTPLAKLLRWTDASGADDPAGDVTWQAPLSVGAGVGAKHVFTVGQPHASDAVLQTPIPVLTLNATSAGGRVNVGGEMLYTAVSSPAQIVANQNNYATAGYARLRLNTDAARSITGMAGGVDGRILYIVNVGAFGLTFTNQDVASVAANRIIVGHGAPLTVAADEAIIFMYDGTTARWRVMAHH
jgi:hypothetical protein